MSQVKQALVLVTAMASAGCGDELHPSQVIEKNRVLGARTEVVGAPERAWPAPGETARTRFLVVDPAERAPLGYALGACVRDTSLGGIPGCNGPVLAEQRVDVPSLEEPSLELVVPDENNLGGERALLVFGVICARGTAQTPGGLAAAWPASLGCTGQNVEATRVFASVPLALDGEQNQNPSLGAASFALGATPWAAPADPWAPPAPCAAAAGSADLPLVSRKDVSPITLALSSDDRELTADGRETLSVASFSTAGELDRAFSFVESNDPSDSPVVSLGFEPPASAPADGRLVRFHFVLRDGRGGADFATRALCLVP